jgi:hypothetical protein
MAGKLSACPRPERQRSVWSLNEIRLVAYSIKRRTPQVSTALELTEQKQKADVKIRGDV